MTLEKPQRIGLVVGRETDLPSALIEAVNGRQAGYLAEFVKLGGTALDQPVPYALILDRMSHEIPYYRAYLKYAAVQGCLLINNPFTWSFDDKFLGTSIANRLGMVTPRTIILPNKQIKKEVAAGAFRNLTYPMDWQGIVDYVGIPAIFKNIHGGGRQLVHRVHSLDELIQRYDESDTLTMVLQQIIESDEHIHCFVIGQEKVLALKYRPGDGRYAPISLENNPGIEQIRINALRLTRVFGYDINMVEFVRQREQTYIINCTNPTPVIDKNMMTVTQFDWCVQQITEMILTKVKTGSTQSIPLFID